MFSQRPLKTSLIIALIMVFGIIPLKVLGQPVEENQLCDEILNPEVIEFIRTRNGNGAIIDTLILPFAPTAMTPIFYAIPLDEKGNIVRRPIIFYLEGPDITNHIIRVHYDEGDHLPIEYVKMRRTPQGQICSQTPGRMLT